MFPGNILCNIYFLSDGQASHALNISKENARLAHMESELARLQLEHVLLNEATSNNEHINVRPADWLKAEVENV